MPQIKLDILQVLTVQPYADRSVDVEVIDRVRGRVILRMQDSEARWLRASLADLHRKFDQDDEMGE